MASSSAFPLLENEHGKGRVRIVKVVRHPSGLHEVKQYNVQILLAGDIMTDSFTEGNNKNVIPTDTCKNTVYYLGKINKFDSIEEFGLIICKHFMTEYPSIVNKISVIIKADRWERVTVKDSRGQMKEHKHVFKRLGPNTPYCKVQGFKKPNTPMTFAAQGGVKSIEIMKTTQSGFVDFHKCPRTTLPEDDDRLVGTSVDAEWTYDTKTLTRKQDFNAIHKAVETAFVQTFAGPADTGIYSPSVQQTMYQMGRAALQSVPSLEKISMVMPNVHNIAFPLDRIGLVNKDHTGKPDIFFPIDEPHGIIQCTVGRGKKNVRARF